MVNYLKGLKGGLKKMEGTHVKTCSACHYWQRIGKESLGECFAHPPTVFKVVRVSVNPLTRQPSQDEGLISHYPVVNSDNRACGEFKLALILVDRKEPSA
jgi:cytochrome c peroxidase